MCSNCQAKATSKCPACRSVFPKNTHATLLGNQVTLSETKLDIPDSRKPYKATLAINFIRYKEETLLNLAIEQLRNLAAESDELLKEALCDHRWKPASPEEHSAIGCGHF